MYKGPQLPRVRALGKRAGGLRKLLQSRKASTVVKNIIREYKIEIGTEGKVSVITAYHNHISN